MFAAPIGTAVERASGKIWPGKWFDATPYATQYFHGWYHTGADLNLNFPHWDADRHADVYAIGAGTVTYAKLYSPTAWGQIVVIHHGQIDGLPLFSRYAHVDNLSVNPGDVVERGQQIASVGNGEGLFAYHLHFDISTTEVLQGSPGDWPGTNQNRVLRDYVNPRQWLQNHVQQQVGTAPVPQFITYKVVASLGLRVRNSPGFSGVQVGSLVHGTVVELEDGHFAEVDGYRWGRIGEGSFSGNWTALGTANGSATYLQQV